MPGLSLKALQLITEVMTERMVGQSLEDLVSVGLAVSLNTIPG
jgi:hypothetical protein